MGTTKKKPAAKKPAPTRKAARAKPRPLNAQQRLFVSEYLKDRNATKAAIRAGYSQKSAQHLGYQLLQNPPVRAAVDEGLEKLLTDNGLTAERTIREMARLAYFDPAKLYDKHGKLLAVPEMDADTRAAIVSIEVEGTRTSKAGETSKVKLADKAAALRMAAQHHGLLKERVEVTGKDGGPVDIRDLSDEERAVRLQNLLAKAMQRAKK